MKEIVLVSVNARYAHPGVGARFLYANLSELQTRAALLEFTLSTPLNELVQEILQRSPRIVAFSVYIWSVEILTRVAQVLDLVAPEIELVIGGPEVREEMSGALAERARVRVIGEGELAFLEVCRALLNLEEPPEVVVARPPDLASLKPPYEGYCAHDLAHRVIYVEASRGCPHQCSFCLSALEGRVRKVPLEDARASFLRLYERGVRSFKFLDRNFNLLGENARALLDFFADLEDEALFLHLEWSPWFLNDALVEALARFRPGAVQLEIGVQTWDEEVARRVERMTRFEQVEANLVRLLKETRVHIHADLLVGLPGEDLDRFAAGFNKLVAIGPHEIQVNLLKRLPGSPMARADLGGRFAPFPPYEVLATESLSFDEVQRLGRFKRYWDLVANSGNFVSSLPALLGEAPFEGFSLFSEWLYGRAQQMHGISLVRLLGFVFDFLVEVRGLPPESVAPILLKDYQKTGRDDVPKVLRPWAPREAREVRKARRRSARQRGRDRQLRHHIEDVERVEIVEREVEE